MDGERKHKNRQKRRSRRVSMIKPDHYRTQYQAGEIEELETMLAGGLEEEMRMLRASTRKMFALANGTQSWDEAITVLGTLGTAASRLAGLLKVQKRLTGEDQRLMAAISSVLTDMMNEMALTKRHDRSPSRRRPERPQPELGMD